MKYLVLLAEGFEAIEALTIVDLLKYARQEVVMATIEDHLIVTSSYGIKVQADEYLKDIDYQEFNVLILPGGLPGALNLAEDALAQEVAKYFMSNNYLVVTICAGAMILAKLQLLDDYKLTIYPIYKNKIANYQKTAIYHDRNLLSASGAGSALFLALELIRLTLSKEIYREVKAAIVYQDVKNLDLYHY